MKNKLFKSSVFFYYVFMFWVGLDFFNSLVQLSTTSEFVTFQALKYLITIITFVTFLAFFIDLKINQSLFKIYIYFRCIILSLFFLLFAVKDPIIYGIGFERFSLEFYFEMLFSLIFGLTLLFLYRKLRNI